MSKRRPADRRTYRKALGAYLRALANDLGLRDWTVTLASERDANESTLASCVCAYGRKCLTVQIGTAWEGHDRDERRQTLVHECLHAHLDPVRLVLANLETNLGDHVFGVARCSLRDAVEYAIDAIASEIAKHYPLPPELPR